MSWVIGLSVLLVAILLGAFSLKPERERRFERELQGRQLLNDDEFIKKYYDDCKIPSDVPLRLRQILADCLGEDWVKVVPNDNPMLVYDEIDPWDVYIRISRVFNVPISLEEAKQLNGTFDSIVRFFASRIPTAHELKGS